MFGNADLARSALDTWAGFVTEPEVVTRSGHEETFAALPAEQRADR